MFFYDGGDIFIDCFIVLCIEVELVFVLVKLLCGFYCMLFDVYNVMDYVILVLELIDVCSYNIDLEIQCLCKVFDIIFDNVVNVGVIFGGCFIKLDELDLCWIFVLFYCNGVIEEIGVVVGVLNYLVNGVVWLVNKFVFYDVQFEVGQIIFGGLFICLVLVCKGDIFYVDYGNMGVISCWFV